jgi:hypothetical protein
MGAVKNLVIKSFWMIWINQGKWVCLYIGYIRMFAEI